MTIPLIKNEENVLMSDNGLIVNYSTEYGMPMLMAQGLALKKEKNFESHHSYCIFVVQNE